MVGLSAGSGCQTALTARTPALAASGVRAATAATGSPW